MIVKLLKDSYLKSDEIFDDFVNDNISDDLDHFSEITLNLEELKPFPLYINESKDLALKRSKFMDAFETINQYYLSLDKDITMNQSFWHSIFLTNFRDYIISNFPSVYQNRNTFRNIVLKAFDWENYIYKSLLAVEYISDQVDINEQKIYYEQIINNLDFFNYLIKYSVFRNDKFIVAILRIVKKFNMTNILKAQIKDRPDLGKDERYGRRVIFEFNKDYPVVLAPMMTEENLEEQFFKYLRKYLPNF
jgi:hypothetical protein